ncbi:unnamed protein product [Leptidea sinapis]|uniref:Uncharacterized protein n=1 Tax=Leptidea sinapis TaxID=189913 RepID=A0A5E4QU37_9NEOP|nr:unnamed protein product [Leptidea sinapis]
MEQFPSYMQEAFFGKDLLEPKPTARRLGIGWGGCARGDIACSVPHTGAFALRHERCCHLHIFNAGRSGYAAFAETERRERGTLCGCRRQDKE